jgi:hypothetical protein
VCAPAEVVDLLVWISKRRIAAPAGAKIFLTECPRGGSSQRDYGHCKQGNRREPKLRRSKHRFAHTGAPQAPKVHAFARGLYCGGKAFSANHIDFVEERGASATVETLTEKAPEQMAWFVHYWDEINNRNICSNEISAREDAMRKACTLLREGLVVSHVAGPNGERIDIVEIRTWCFAHASN